MKLMTSVKNAAQAAWYKAGVVFTTILGFLMAAPAHALNKTDLTQDTSGGKKFDDIAIVPNRRTRGIEEVNLRWRIDALHFDFPIVAAPMDSEPVRTRRTVSVSAVCMRAGPSSKRPISS